MDNLQINYRFNIGYFDKAIEVDQKIRQFTSNFYIKEE